jgi:basic amino acid/polyamine antiporter, APA family
MLSMRPHTVLATPTAREQDPSAQLVRQIGFFDATMVVMGGIVGAGIFINPYVVAQRVHSPVLIIAAWAFGGFLALIGAFIYAELADRMPAVGGQYAYLKEAYHPALGFLYGWVLLLVVQTGGMAAVTVTFARYFLELSGGRLDPRVVGTFSLAILTFINCLGVKLGSRVQSGLTVLKILSIACLVAAGLFLTRDSHSLLHPILDQPFSGGLLSAFGAAMIPVLFAYGGWQTANFIAAEMKQPRRDLPRALVVGVAGVISLYITVNVACLRSLGAAGLASTTTPASAVMALSVGYGGVRLIAAGIAVSTLGFLSQSILTAPRVYFAMAADGLFFRAVGLLSPRTHVPVIAILLQSLWTAVIVFSGRYEQILNYVVSMDFLFFGLTATCLFVFRRRDRLLSPSRDHGQGAGYRVPGHPFTTLLFVLISWAVVANTIYRYPANSLLGMLILVLGLPVYGFWSRRAAHSTQNE